MKKIFAIVFGLLALFAAVMVYGVWRASDEPVSQTPVPLETGRAKLRAQFEEAKKLELQAEKQDWDSPNALRGLMQGHKQRIDELKDNKQAAEIVAYDRDAVDRLQKRIAEIAEQQAARAAAKEAEQKSQPEPEKPQPESQQ